MRAGRSAPIATDPDIYRGQRYAEAYKLVDSGVWQLMPDRAVMNVANPFKRSGMACAFKVTRVISLAAAEVSPITIEWYQKGSHRWSSGCRPTRGEFLIRRGGQQPLRRGSRR